VSTEQLNRQESDAHDECQANERVLSQGMSQLEDQ
jgi:hypothetical protein